MSDWIATGEMLANRGFLFGDGLFETMVFTKGELRFAEMHFQRLLEGCEVLGLASNMLSSITQLNQVLSDLFGNEKILRVRWNVYRSGIGKYTPQTDSIEESIQIQNYISAPRTKDSAYVHPDIFLYASPWSHCKTLNALCYVLANRDRASRGLEEVVLLNYDNYVAEAGAANIFWYKDGVFYTPSLETGCISGVGRRIIMETLKNKNIKIQEGYYKVDDIYNAESVFVSNATGISYLTQLEGIKLGQQRFDYLNSLFEI